MDLLDQFAMAAMQGELASQTSENWANEWNLAARAYEVANAMIAEREKGSVDSVYGIKQKLIQAIKEQHNIDVSNIPFSADHLVQILITGRITAG